MLVAMVKAVVVLVLVLVLAVVMVVAAVRLLRRYWRGAGARAVVQEVEEVWRN